MKKTNLFATALLALSLGASVSASLAHTVASHKNPEASLPISTEELAFGKQGDTKKVTRTIAIDMNDMMRFNPAEINIKQGETIKFVVKNSGKMMHELVLGTMEELKEHGEMMKKHPGMEHDEPYMSHVSPGKTQTLVWHFTRAGEFYFACLIAGHFEAGMLGKINVLKG